MQLEDFKPENELELTILDAKLGAGPNAELINMVVDSDLHISSKTEVQQDGSGFNPLLLGESKSPLVAAFSSLARPDLHRHMAEFVLKMKGRDFLLRLPPGFGVVLNPGYVAQLIISADVVADLKKRLGSQKSEQAKFE